VFQGHQEILINLPAAFTADPAAFGGIGDEAGTLFASVGQLIKGIGEFKPRDK
jgi:hypothetical protein